MSTAVKSVFLPVPYLSCTSETFRYYSLFSAGCRPLKSQYRSEPGQSKGLRSISVRPIGFMKDGGCLNRALFDSLGHRGQRVGLIELKPKSRRNEVEASFVTLTRIQSDMKLKIGIPASGTGPSYLCHSRI